MKEISMAPHIDGPLYYECMGREGPVMAFVHPNPMDQSCWLYQMARFSTWYRCIAIDIPGYGRSPKAGAGLTMRDMAQGCWEAIDDAFGTSGGGERAILVGCSVGSIILPHMFHHRPDRTAALILSGTGYNPAKAFAQGRIDGYTRDGVSHRWGYTFEDLSPAFRATPMAHYFAELFTERNDTADAETIIHQFRAIQQPEPEGHFERIACPTTILTGSEDSAHQSAFALQRCIPGCELKTLPGAGHACYMEQPWLFDRFMIEFLKKNRLFRA
jgi:pimeloyl-ACP methyl ester carboxylesterase